MIMFQHRMSSRNGTPVTAPSESLRQRHADVTQRAILDAARRLFVERGYAHTPMRALAYAAGVAVQTIYSSFGSKGGVVTGLIDHIDREQSETVVVRRM